MKRYRLEKDRNGADLVEAKRWPDEATYMHTPDVIALLKRVLPHVENTAKIIEDFGIQDARCKDVLDLHNKIKSIIGAHNEQRS